MGLELGLRRDRKRMEAEDHSNARLVCVAGFFEAKAWPFVPKLASM